MENKDEIEIRYKNKKLIFIKITYFCSAFTYLPYSNLFATGHETGYIKLWNVESGNSITLAQKSKKYKFLIKI